LGDLLHVSRRILSAAPSQFVCVVHKRRLLDAFDVIRRANLATDELNKPNRHRVGTMPCTTDVEERLNWEKRINGYMTDPTLLPCLL
jgi:hypothetical protein